MGVTLWARTVSGEVAEWSKALRQGRNLLGGVGSNPTLTIFVKNGDAGYRSLYLSHAERALYHLSYTPTTAARAA